MSNNSISDLLRRARGESKPGQPPLAANSNAVELEELPEEYVCYAKLRGPQQLAFMLELRLSSGDSDSWDYSLLSRATHNRSAGITLFFSGGKVVIAGKNLRPLFEGIQDHRVTWVAVAANPKEASRDPEATVVTVIEVEAG